MSSVESGQQDLLDEEIARAGKGSVHTVTDSAILGTDRDMYVYGSGGAWMHIDVEDFVPKVRVLNAETTAPKSGSRSAHALVRAADVRTYQLLSRYWWVSSTGREHATRHGGYTELALEPNIEGLAYVDPDDLEWTAAGMVAEAEAAVRQPWARPEK